MISIITSVPEKKSLFKVTYKDLNGEKTTFVHQEVIFKYGILPQKEFKDSAFKSILKENDFIKAYQLALNKLAIKNYTESSLKKLLQNEPLSHTLLEEIIARLKKENYINDEAWLKDTVNEFLLTSLKGPSSLKQKLLKEGFTSLDIETAYSEIPDEVWDKKCYDFINKLNQTRPQESINKRIQTLKQRAFIEGYNEHTIEKAVQRLDFDIDEENLLELKVFKLTKQYDIKNPKEKQKLITIKYI